MENRISRTNEHYWYKAFLLGLFLSAAFFIPYIVIGHGYFLYYGDFNVQQVPFYQMIHDAIRNGEWQWSTTTDLGSSVVGSYTFYMLGSPFFWLTLPFPSKVVPYLMGPLLILKFGTASLTGYIYLRRYVRDKNLAVIGGILYAFSGFSVYNVFFNHFHEAIITFPLLLAAIDEYMETKRRGVVALAVFASCLVNYYFFVGMVAFVIIYWFLRMFTGSYKISPWDIIPLGFEVIIGFAATAVLLLPTVLFVTQNPRLDDAPQGYGALVYGSEQRYLHIISSLFFPPDIPARPNFTPDSNSKWASIAAWLPVYGMTGVIAFLQTKSNSWLKMSYYARWFYMLTLMMTLATIMAIENSTTKWQPAIRLSLIITTFIAIGIGFMPNDNDSEDLKFFETFGIEKYPDRFWLYVAIAMASLSMTALLARARIKNKKTFYVKAMSCVGVVAVLYSGYIIGLGKSHSYDVDNFIIPYVLNNGDDLAISKKELANCRSDFYETMDNVGMFWQIPNIQAFQSVVPGSIYTFYPSVGVTRDVGSRPETEYYGLRALLSVKYVFDSMDDDDNFENDEGKTRMPGYKFVSESNGYKAYENKNYIPYGFWYDNYITVDQYYECDEKLRHLILLKAMVLNDEYIEEFGGLMNHVEDINSFVYDVPTYTSDCKTLRSHACQTFVYGKNSFHAQITTPGNGGDKLVFFSVPYEAGWTATVNGESAEVMPINIGFMAVKVPAGSVSMIEFKYRTPGLFEGAVITAVCIVLYIVYLIVSAKHNKLKPRLKFRKTYKVAAVGSDDEIGERYKNLRLSKGAMARKRVSKPDDENIIDNDSVSELSENADTDSNVKEEESTQITKEDNESIAEESSSDIANDAAE